MSQDPSEYVFVDDGRPWLLGTAAVSGDKMFIIGKNSSISPSNSNVYSYDLGTPFDVSTASFNQYLDVSGGDSDPGYGLTWKPDGSKMYFPGGNQNTIVSYTLSTAYDISTATLNQTFDVSTQVWDPNGMDWNGEGTKMYTDGGDDNLLLEYDVGTAWDISTATFNQSIITTNLDAYFDDGFHFGDSGAKLYAAGPSNDSIKEYTLSTPYDISTTALNQSFSTASDGSGIATSVSWNNDGSKMYVTDIGDFVFEYEVSTPWDISTASRIASYDMGSEDTIPADVAWN